MSVLFLRTAVDDEDGPGAPSKTAVIEGRRDDEAESLRRILPNPPSSIEVARDKEREPLCWWCEWNSSLMPSCTAPSGLDDSRGSLP